MLEKTFSAPMDFERRFILLIGVCFIFLSPKITRAQDPFFLESRQIQAFLNPALTGLNGSFTIRTIAKDQYLGESNNGFLSMGVNVENSHPCHNFDYGFYNIVDREGDGLLTSNYLAGNFVYTIPVEVFGALHNFRIGTKFQWIHKYIDWSRLYFSDQLDAKYFLRDELGNFNISSFQSPNWNSADQLELGLGLIHSLDVGIDYIWSLTWGFSLENYTSLFEDREYDSLLRLEQGSGALFGKYSFYFSPEFPLKNAYRDYFGLKPSYVFRRHGNLVNQQIGFEANYRKLYSLGMYFNYSDLKDIELDTKALVFEGFFRIGTTRNSQLNAGIQYMHNIGGLSSIFGQTIQFTFRYNHRKDGCGNKVGSKDGCPATSRRHQLLYENIWFSPVQGINM